MPRFSGGRSTAAFCRRRASQGACFILSVLRFDTFLIKGRSLLRPQNRVVGDIGRAQASDGGAGANAICLEIRKNLRCLSSDRRHAATEGAVGPTEMCALSRPDLGSKRSACSAESLSQVCDRWRGKRDRAAIEAASSAGATPTRSLNLV